MQTLRPKPRACASSNPAVGRYRPWVGVKRWKLERRRRRTCATPFCRTRCAGLDELRTRHALDGQRFEGRFANKETLGKRFGQLADLRNGIRHSRSVDEITCKEGEAAILWFEQVTG